MLSDTEHKAPTPSFVYNQGYLTCPTIKTCTRRESCPWRHGPTDSRTLCSSCGHKRVPHGSTKCASCTMRLRGKKPKDLMCQFYTSTSGCVKDTSCQYKHGADDKRPECQKCRHVRVDRKGKKCKRCRLASKIGDVLAVVKVMQKTACSACLKPTSIVPVTEERFCTNKDCRKYRSPRLCSKCKTIMTPYTCCKGCSKYVVDTGRCTAFRCTKAPVSTVAPVPDSGRREVAESYFCAEHAQVVLQEHHPYSEILV